MDFSLVVIDPLNTDPSAFSDKSSWRPSTFPGDVDLQGRRQWIRVDRVSYSDGSHQGDTPGDTDPWPAQPDDA